MSQFSGLFQKIGSAKPPSEFANRLEPGTHRVALERYEPKLSGKPNSQQVIIEADFTVISSQRPDGSTLHAQGETRGWAFFPGSDEYGYSDGRAQKFIQVVGQCMGDPTPVDQLGDQLCGPGQPGRGIVLIVTVVQVFGKDGAARTNRKGEPITNAVFAPVPQTREQVAATRADLDQRKPLQLNQSRPQPQAHAATQQGWGQGQAQQNQGQWGQPQQAAPQGPPPQQGWGQPAPQGPPPGYQPQQAAPQGPPPQQGQPDQGQGWGGQPPAPGSMLGGIVKR